MCFSDPSAVTDAECPTCCCTSSNNVKYYNESEGEPSCTAPNARYQVKLVGTWTLSCHPDYYFNNSIWSPLTGISHKPEYELWNACMCNASAGVALVSQTGDTSQWMHIHQRTHRMVLNMHMQIAEMHLTCSWIQHITCITTCLGMHLACMPKHILGMHVAWLFID